MAARIIGFKGDFPFVPFMLEMRWTSFGIRLSKRFSARADGEWGWLTMLSKQSLLVLTPNLGSPIIAVIIRCKNRNCMDKRNSSNVLCITKINIDFFTQTTLQPSLGTIQPTAYVFFYKNIKTWSNRGNYVIHKIFYKNKLK